MIPLIDKANTDYNNGAAPLVNYPFGNIRDDDGSNNGTDVNKLNHADFHQFFEALMFFGNVTPNGLPENVANTYQLIIALNNYIRSRQASETEKGTGEIATQAETLTGTDDTRFITPLKLKTLIDPATWAAPTYSANWADLVSTQITQFRKAGNKVEIRGGFFRGSGNANGYAVVFTLPVGSRPASTLYYPITNVDGTNHPFPSVLAIAPSGDVSIFDYITTGSTYFAASGAAIGKIEFYV